MISLIFLFRFSLIFKLIFVLACFSLFCNFSCINFCSLSENFEAWMKIKEAEKQEKERKIRYVANFRYIEEICYATNFHFIANSLCSRRNSQKVKKIEFIFIFIFLKKNIKIIIIIIIKRIIIIIIIIK